jgi:hypothetical protein
MVDTNYFGIVKNELEKLKRLHDQRLATDGEIVKSETFISAAANLLPESERTLVLDALETLQELYRLREVGLTDAIRGILKSSPGQWFTAANVRDRLISLGFDFSGYTANPLASVSTTLRRAKSEGIETTNIDGGVTAYRWKGTTDDMAKIEALKQALGNRAKSARIPTLTDTIEAALTNALKKK